MAALPRDLRTSPRAAFHPRGATGGVGAVIRAAEVDPRNVDDVAAPGSAGYQDQARLGIPPGGSGALGYQRPLDGLRGIATLLVIGHHAQVPFLHGGFLGVDIFFTLSGFLITTLLLQEWDRTGRIHLAYFYARRFLRLLPALVVLVLALCLYTTVFRPFDESVQTYKAAAVTLL